MTTIPPISVLLIETHSPASTGGTECIRLAEALLDAGDAVHLHLMQNGATWLQQDPDTVRELGRHHDGRLLVTVDDVSLDLRGIDRAAADGVATVIDIDTLMRAMCEPSTKTLWHS
ncbi:hypothetical protein [Cupriavidus campinensis]